MAGAIVNLVQNIPTFTAVMDFSGGSLPVTVFVTNNTLNVLSIVPSGVAGEFIVQLSESWPEQSTVIFGNVVLNQNSGVVIGPAFILQDLNTSLPDQIKFKIIDYLGLPISDLYTYKAALEIKAYQSYTIL